jgi:murein L,D-transpeptidase YcbB/YkuD
MPVIVGRAVRTETPVFIGDMRYVEFSPYWNVPPNILRNEILPALRRDPAYLQRHDMELVRTGRDRSITTTVDAAALAALESGALRVRQRPGPRNALDGIKFVLPNTMDIYLHGTPAPALFKPARRDFSHGCIRVADPAALARFVLRDQPEWTAARIEAATASGTMTTVTLPGSIPVVVFYTTAIAAADERALFLPDVYGHDRKLEAALRAARAGSR